MSDLTFAEKRKLERLLGMGSGYVLNFSNRTFEEFVFDSTGKQIYDEKYEKGSGSKANRLRAFWELEPNYVVGKLLADLVSLATEGSEPEDAERRGLLEGCERVARRLLQGAEIADIDALTPAVRGRDFEILARSVKDAIDRNELEAGLDRLHTYVVKYVRHLCEKHGVSVERDKPLHSLFGEYVKKLRAEGRLQATMTERILRLTISVFEAFNHVRNDQSLAHDNELLNYDESLLIFNHVTSLIRFINRLEEGEGPGVTCV